MKELAAGRGTALLTLRGGFVFAKRSKPWIAAVSGKALAGGCEILSRALIAAAGGLYRLPRALPRNLAIEPIMAA